MKPENPAPPRPLRYEETLASLALADPRVVVLTAENRAPIRGLPQRLGPRFIDVGIAEQTMVGMAAGLALRGRIPVVHALATFLTMRAFEFIRTDVGIAGLPVKLVGTVPGFLSEANGPTHQALEDVALMRGIPGMDVVCPADDEELSRALPVVLASPRPTYVRYVSNPPVVAHAEIFELGRAEHVGPEPQGARSPVDVALLTYGHLVGEVVGAARLLGSEGIRAQVLSLTSLVPLDEAAVLTAAASCRLLVTIEDHFVSGGLATAMAELFLRAEVTKPTLRLAMDGRWFRPGLLADVLRVEGFTASALSHRIKAALPSAAFPADGGTQRSTP